MARNERKKAEMAVKVTGSLDLRRGKRGDVFHAKLRVGGKPRMKKIGPAWKGRSKPEPGYFTERMAKAALEEIKTDLRRGAGVPEVTGTTFADAASEFLRYVGEVRRIDPATVRDYRGVIDGYLDDEFGSQPIESVTADSIDAYKERLIAEGKLSNRTIVRHLTVLHGIFKRAMRVWGLSQNPAAADLVERPKVVYSGEFDTYDRADLERLATAAESPQDAALYRVAAFTGLRTGELFALRWRDVDFVGGLLHVRHNWDHKFRVEKVPKGKRVRSVPLMPDAMDALATLKERRHFTADGDLVFCSEVGEHLDYYSHRRRYQESLTRAKLRTIRFHDLRHAFGTAAITELDPYSVQSYMGHSHYSTTQRYLHHKPRREDAAKLQRAFGKTTASPAVADRTASHTANSPEPRVTESNNLQPATHEVPESTTT